MRFVIGGKSAGKRSYVKENYGVKNIPDAALDNIMTSEAVCNFHMLIRQNPDLDIEHLLDEIDIKNHDLIIISDEVGCGVVPIDAKEREWRECAGRACCLAAKRAETVVRVVCGIGTVIK